MSNGRAVGCEGCGVNLESRAVWCRVRSPRAKNGWAEKRVYMKPAQLVVGVRVEGSMGLTPEFFDSVDRWSLRLCLECVQGAGSVPAAIAVALDRRTERGE